MEYLTRADSGIISEPFAFPRSGFYRGTTTALSARNESGHYWSSRMQSTTLSSYQAFSLAVFLVDERYNNGGGFMIRYLDGQTYS